MVHALGLGSFQVGRSHECDYPASIRDLPVCTAPRIAVDGSSAEIDGLVKQSMSDATSVYTVFRDVVDDLRPTHILTQTQCKVCAVSLEDVEKLLSAGISSNPRIVALEPNSFSDVWDDIRRVAQACGLGERGECLVAELRERIRRIAEKAALTPHKPSVACIEWLEPIMAAGNWVPEMVELAGGVSLFGKARLHSPWMSWAELVAADPDVIVAMPCGFDIERTRAELYWLTQRSGWNGLRSVRNQRVYVVDGNQYFNRPGPRLVESLQILAEMLHPDIFDPALERTGWLGV